MEGIVTIVGLKPETTYAVRLAALNGKGLGEISTASEFKTQPVRKYTQRLASSPDPLSSGGWRGPRAAPSSVRIQLFVLQMALLREGSPPSPLALSDGWSPAPFMQSFPKELGEAVAVAGPAC